MEEFVCEYALHHQPRVFRRPFGHAELKTDLVEHRVAGSVPALVLADQLRCKTVGGGPGAESEQSKGSVVDVIATVTTVTVVIGVGHRNAVEQHGFGVVDLLDERSDQRYYCSALTVNSRVPQLQVKDIEMLGGHTRVEVIKPDRVAVDGTGELGFRGCIGVPVGRPWCTIRQTKPLRIPALGVDRWHQKWSKHVLSR